jgi:hypothetical protein
MSTELKEKEALNLLSALKGRFGDKQVLPVKRDGIRTPLVLIDLQEKSHISLVMTNGLSDYFMPVPLEEKGKEYNELYFCLPSYWDLSDESNPEMNWVFEWIDRLANYVVENKTWFGHGHTMPCGKEMSSLSKTMKQNHFFLMNPVLLEGELSPVQLGEKQVHFLSIVPIFEDEMDYKQGKGTFKLAQKLRGKGISEKLDDYRFSILRSKWSFRS